MTGASRRRVLAGLVVVSAALGAVVPEASAQIVTAPAMRAAFLANNPAMVVKDAKTGTLGGPAIELARELARRRGVAAELLGVQTPQQVIDAVSRGEADIGFVAYNPEREGMVDFSQPFMLVLQSFVVTQASPIRSVKEIDRAGLRVGARTADSMALYLARTLKAARLVEMVEGTGNEGAQAVLNGDLEAFGTNRQRLMNTVRTMPGLRVLDDDLYGVEQTIIVPRGQPDTLKAANQFIDDVRSSGFLRGALDRSGVVGVAVAPPR